MRRPVYVVHASDCEPTGILGAHTAHSAAEEHFQSIRKDRERWYRTEFCQGYRFAGAWEREITTTIRECEMVLAQTAGRWMPPTITIRIVRCP